MPRPKIDLGTPQTLPSGRVRWARMVKGKRWKSSSYESDSRRSRSAAWGEFQAWKRERRDREETEQRGEDGLLLETDPDRADALAKMAMVRDVSELTGNAEAVTFARSVIHALRRADASGVAQLRAALALHEPPDDELAHGSELAKRRRENAAAAAVGPTCGEAAAAYAAGERARADAGAISQGHAANLRQAAAEWCDYYGEERPLSELAEADVSGYYTLLAQRIDAGSNPNTIKDAWDNARTFLGAACDEHPDVPRPGNLRSRRLRFHRTPAEKTPWTCEEFAALYGLAGDAMRLHLLLALNCGMTQADTSRLTPGEVDFAAGRIVRARSKRERLSKGKAVPKTNWLLWDETARLLRERGHRTAPVLRNANGGPLLESGFNAKGKPTKTDNVASAWKRLKAKALKAGAIPQGWAKTLKNLRDTGAVSVKRSPHGAMFAAYLAHSTATRFYVGDDEPVPEFDKGVAWLGERFGFPTDPARLAKSDA